MHCKHEKLSFVFILKIELTLKKIKIINWMHIDAKILNYLIQLRL